MAIELGHQVEARQRAGKILPKPRADVAFDQVGAGQQPQPQPQGFVLGLVGTGRGGGGTGEGTIGLGNTGLIGKGGGGGKGSGYGSGSGAGFGGRGKRVPQVRQAKATVQGALDRDIIRRIVRAHINEVRSCYNAGLTKDPNLQGRVAVNFVIAGTGKVASAVVQESTIKDQSVGNCIANIPGTEPGAPR